MDNKIEYNEYGYGFVPDKELSEYLHKDVPRFGGMELKGMPNNYIVLQVHHETSGHVNNILYNTEIQQPVDELGLGESCYCKLDMFKLAWEHDV